MSDTPRTDEACKRNGFVATLELCLRLEKECAELRKALEARNKQIGVACLKHDLTHSLACGHCFAELRKDAERYRWIRTAGAWESEIGMEGLSENPSLFDAAVDAAMG